MAERRRQPGTASERTVGPPPGGRDERNMERRRHSGTKADRGRFHFEREAVTLPAWLAYGLLGLGVALALWWGGNRLGGVEDKQDAITQSRIATSDDFCRELNANARRANRFGDYIGGLLLAGVVLPGDRVTARDKRGLPLEVEPGPLSRDFTRRYGLPGPAERLAKAHGQVDELNDLRRPEINCEALKQKIRAESAPPP